MSSQSALNQYITAFQNKITKLIILDQRVFKIIIFIHVDFS
jgi:hypothetical protein